MDPVSIAAATAVVGGGLQAAGTVMQGREQARSQAFEAQNLQSQAADQARQQQEYQIAAAQDEAKRRDDLTSNLETISAIRAGRGVGSGSPTGMAILENQSRSAETDIRTSRLNYLTRAEQSRMASENSKTASGLAQRASKMSILSSYVAAGADVASTGYKIASTRRT